VTVADDAKPLAVVRLAMSDFRCYADFRLEVAPRPVVLTGPNGAGKTNILEALSFLAPGRGLRRARLADVARRQGPMAAGAMRPWGVAALVRHQGSAVELATGRDGDSERRLLRVDGKAARSQAALGDWISVLWLVPAMDRLFSDSAGGRRRFLDRLVLGFDPTHGSRASAFEHAARERSRLVREGSRDRRWFEAVETAMARHGTALAVARRQVVLALNEACQHGIGPFPAADLSLEGALENQLAATDAALTEAWLRDRLAAARCSEDGVVGPQRSDFVVRHRDKDLPAPLCSTGEQKALLLSILLAQARLQAERLGLPPILLLDEVTAHLDGIRRAALWDELEALGLQSWMTGTDPSLFADLGERGQYFGVAAGHVTPLRQ
jgi:DNA replication and repair protein RecF